jgi:hypothetical protein
MTLERTQPDRSHLARDCQFYEEFVRFRVFGVCLTEIARDINAADTCRTYILPKLKISGWEDEYITGQLVLKCERIVPIGADAEYFG